MKQTILTIILALTLFVPAQFWQQDKTPKQTETVSDTVANNDDEGIAAYPVTTSDDNDAVGYDSALSATSDQTDMTLQAQLQEYLKQNSYE